MRRSSLQAVSVTVLRTDRAGSTRPPVPGATVAGHDHLARPAAAAQHLDDARSAPTGAPRSVVRTDGLEALAGFVADRTGTDVATVHTGRRCPHCGSDEHGRPWVTVAGAAVDVGVARTPGRIALVTGPGRVGVDVERRSRVLAAPVDVTTDAEAARGADPALLWAVKEAVLKRDGRGLRVDLLDLDVTVTADVGADGGRGALVVWAGGDAVDARVWELDEDLVLAVATDPGVRVDLVRSTDLGVPVDLRG